MYRLIKLSAMAAYVGIFMYGLNAYAHTQVDLSSLAVKSAKLALIEGKIKSIDLNKMEIILEELDLLGLKPLMLTQKTSCYLGNEKTDIVSIRGGSKLEKENELGFNQLRVGDYVKCNYSRRDGKLIAVRIIKITFQTDKNLLE